MGKPIIINTIEINGEEILIETLSDEQRREISDLLQDNFMKPLGYVRKTA